MFKYIKKVSSLLFKKEKEYIFIRKESANRQEMKHEIVIGTAGYGSRILSKKITKKEDKN